MSLSVAFFAFALVIRVVLDLAGLVKPAWRLDIAYCVLFAAAAVTLLIEDRSDPLGYASMLLAAGWGVRAFVMFKRQPVNRTPES
jgi:hypothetical protein